MLEPDLLASIIKHHRKASGLSQFQLSELAGVGKTVVFDIEKGKETVQLDTLRKVLRVLNIKVKLESQLMEKLINNNEKS
jgi:y4mF family transcriptional regulator